MHNKNKHSIKCNKRDKVELVDVVYRVFGDKKFGSPFKAEFKTKFEALSYISANQLPDELYFIYKITIERVLS